ncbi:MAG TPA: hypothetical protein VFF14_02575 [Candidatus Deferrimicrobium sp.]|nr:hypothetical protein [Candidatus Deferrimicrobium sp.]
MNFPIGSLLALIVFILISSGVINLTEQRFKVLVYGLAGTLLGSFLVLPLPAPKGLTLTLNTGHALIPLLVALFLWAEAGVEDKYRASLGTLTVGLSLYGVSSLLDIEPGLIAYPLLFIVPITILISLLTGKTPLASCLSIVCGCTLVSVLRFLEGVLTQDMVATLELPGSLVWDTMSLSIFCTLGVGYLLQVAGEVYKGFIFARESKQQTALINLQQDSMPVIAENCGQTENQLINPEQ